MTFINMTLHEYGSRPDLHNRQHETERGVYFPEYCCVPGTSKFFAASARSTEPLSSVDVLNEAPSFSFYRKCRGRD